MGEKEGANLSSLEVEAQISGKPSDEATHRELAGLGVSSSCSVYSFGAMPDPSFQRWILKETLEDEMGGR